MNTFFGTQPFLAILERLKSCFCKEEEQPSVVPAQEECLKDDDSALLTKERKEEQPSSPLVIKVGEEQGFGNPLFSQDTLPTVAKREENFAQLLNHNVQEKTAPTFGSPLISAQIAQTLSSKIKAHELAKEQDKTIHEPLPKESAPKLQQRCKHPSKAAVLQSREEDAPLGDQERNDKELFLQAMERLERHPQKGAQRPFEKLQFATKGFNEKPKLWGEKKEERQENQDATLFMRAIKKLEQQKPQKKPSLDTLEERVPQLKKTWEAKKQAQKVREKQKAPAVLMDPDQKAFLRAMADTEPLPKSKVVFQEKRVPVAVPVQENLADLLEGKFTFEFYCRDEYFEGFIAGLDPITVDKLRAGQFSPEAHLDLHGCTVDEAFEALRSFLKASWYKGLRTVLLIPGRGHNSLAGVSVLRGRLQNWLTHEPLKRVVLAFCTAQPSDGGPGSIYVLLRKYRKKGRIAWERMSDDLIQP